jgi:hypothetical protein
MFVLIWQKALEIPVSDWIEVLNSQVQISNTNTVCGVIHRNLWEHMDHSCLLVVEI